MSIQQTFKALGDPTRREILERLSHDGRLTAGQLGEVCLLALASVVWYELVKIWRRP